MSSKRRKRVRDEHTFHHGGRALSRLNSILSTPAAKRTPKQRHVLGHMKRQMYGKGKR